MMKIVAKAHNWRAYGYRRQVAANHRAYPVVDHNRVRKKKKKKKNGRIRQTSSADAYRPWAKIGGLAAYCHCRAALECIKRLWLETEKLRNVCWRKYVHLHVCRPLRRLTQPFSRSDMYPH